MKNARLTLLAALACAGLSCAGLQQRSAPARIGSELDYRQRLIEERIMHGKQPEITSDFLLAGLTLDPQRRRRFTNFSGDQSGRYLSALSQVDAQDNPVDLHQLAADIVGAQKADGRFGADSLVFEAKAMQGPHMALLWGNGRLLTGLLDYYARYPEKTSALEAAKKLGAFLMGVADAASQPAVIDRFKTMGALGFICFTQITEGMVKLYEHTGDQRYLAAAEHIYPLLPEPGNQHSHGYLNTLRGVVMLYEATRNPKHLAYAEEAFEKIVGGDDYMPTGGVPEFFAYSASAEGVRDEGCSEADLLMFFYQLWQATGKMTYLDSAEYLLVNHMLYNQFQTGDFGHHEIARGFGFSVPLVHGRSWWCCNYHGLQALVETRKVVFSAEGHLARLNLFYPASFENDDLGLTLTKEKSALPTYAVRVRAVKTPEARLAIRNPHWSSATRLTVNGRRVGAAEENGYLALGQALKPGDVIRIELTPVLKLVDARRQEVAPGRPAVATVVYGPWLMAVDDVYDPRFMSELSQRNVIYAGGPPVHAGFESGRIPEGTFNPEAYLTFDYQPEGYYQAARVTLRPLAESSLQPPSNVRFWFNVASKAGR